MKHLDLLTLWQAMSYLYNLEISKDSDLSIMISQDSEWYIYSHEIAVIKTDDICYLATALNGKMISCEEIPTFNYLS